MMLSQAEVNPITYNTHTHNKTNNNKNKRKSVYLFVISLLLFFFLQKLKLLDVQCTRFQKQQKKINKLRKKQIFMAILPRLLNRQQQTDKKQKPNNFERILSFPVFLYCRKVL